MNNRLRSRVASGLLAWGALTFALSAGLATMQTALGKPMTSIVAPPARHLTTFHHLAKRSFFDIECKGVYDKSIFARVDRICEDCYNLFREPEVHSLCRRKCFKNDIFDGCLQTLLRDDEKEEFARMIDFIGRKKRMS